MMFGPLWMIIVLAVVVAAVVLLVRRLGRPTDGPASQQPGPLVRTPFEILEERFARGEIDKDECEGRRRVLGE